MSSKKDSRKTGFKSRLQPVLHNINQKVLQRKFDFAVYTRNNKVIRSCLDRGVDPNHRSSEYGWAPLHLLAERDDHILGFFLLENAGSHVNLEVRTMHGFTSLHLTCLFNCKRFAGLLLEHGADCNKRDRFDKTPLHLAVIKENYAIVRKLLKVGAKINTLDCFGNTPLSLSITDSCNFLIARTLFQFGANMSVEHLRPLHVFFETILFCRSLSNIDFVLLLLENGVDVNMQDERTGRTCMHFVAITGYLELAVILAYKGANSDIVDYFKATPAKVAMEHGNNIIFDYFRKKYKPPSLLKTNSLIFLWCKKLKARLIERRQEMASMEKQ